MHAIQGKKEEVSPPGEALEAARQIVTTMPRMFKTVMRHARETDAVPEARDMGDAQTWVLHALHKGPQVSTALARRFNVTTPTMTAIVEALVAKGYVERTPDTEDRRRIILTLTAAGSEMSEQVHAHVCQALARFLSPLSHEQLKDVVQAFSHIRSLLPDDNTGCPVAESSG